MSGLLTHMRSVTRRRSAASANYLNVPTASGASTPDQASLHSGASAYDLRAEIAPISWASGAYQTILCYDSGAGADRWAFYLNPAGNFESYFTNIPGATIVGFTTIGLGFSPGSRHGVRVLHNVPAGTMDFFTSADYSTWTPFDAQFTGLATAGLKTLGVNPVVRVGNDFSSEPLLGQFSRSSVLIAGSPILDMDWRSASPGTGPWVATTGETYSRFGTASVIAG